MSRRIAAALTAAVVTVILATGGASGAAGRAQQPPMNVASPSISGTAQVCADGVDNDGDGHSDMADPGCQNSADTSEADDPDGWNNCAVEGNLNLHDSTCAFAGVMEVRYGTGSTWTAPRSFTNGSEDGRVGKGCRARGSRNDCEKRVSLPQC